MGKRTNGTTTVGELAILASSVGLVEKSESGRQAFCAWYAVDQKAARKELFSRVAARRVAASASKAAAASTASTSAGLYPRGWLAAAGVRARRSKGARITEAGDR
jgi:ABC-type phosphate/phosphonate transport system substrate-binding protein